MLYHNEKTDIFYTEDVIMSTFEFAKHTLFAISHMLKTNPRNQNTHNLTIENFKKFIHLLKIFSDFYYPINTFSFAQYKKEFYTLPIEQRKQYILDKIKITEQTIKELKDMFS